MCGGGGKLPSVHFPLVTWPSELQKGSSNGFQFVVLLYSAWAPTYLEKYGWTAHKDFALKLRQAKQAFGDTYGLGRGLFQFSSVYFHDFKYLYDLKKKNPKSGENLKAASESLTS